MSLIESALNHRWSHSTAKYGGECEDKFAFGMVTSRSCYLQDGLLDLIQVRDAVGRILAVPLKVLRVVKSGLRVDGFF
jgi:hypothetical protein